VQRVTKFQGKVNRRVAVMGGKRLLAIKKILWGQKPHGWEQEGCLTHFKKVQKTFEPGKRSQTAGCLVADGQTLPKPFLRGYLRGRGRQTSQRGKNKKSPKCPRKGPRKRFKSKKGGEKRGKPVRGQFEGGDE